MALDWLPIYPGQVPHRRLRLEGGSAPPFTAKTIPVPDVLATRTFFPTYPGQVPHRRSQVARAELLEPFLFPAALAPEGWLPIYPGMVSHRRLTAPRPTLFEPPPGALVVVAQSLAWQAKYPDRVAHHRPPTLGGSFDAISPTVAAAGETCVHLIDAGFTTPALLAATLTATGFAEETLTTPGLVTEDLC